MKVLFVSSGNSKCGLNPIISNQGESFAKYSKDIRIDYYTVVGKGLRGYVNNIKPLRRKIHKEKFDVIHAHYSLSAFIASISGSNPLVVSLMGSDVKANFINKMVTRLCYLFLSWKAVIVKSEDMKQSLGIKNAVVIPNGVDIDRFRPFDKKECLTKLGWNLKKKHILFASDPEREEKNYHLTMLAVEHLEGYDIEVHTMVNIPNHDTPIWYNAADFTILTSLWEGSPNSVKESMACNSPVVATDVGDIKWLFGDEEGYFLTSFDENDCARQIENAIRFSEKQVKTNGRQRIIDLGLTSSSIAESIFDVYRSVL